MFSRGVTSSNTHPDAEEVASSLRTTRFSHFLAGQGVFRAVPSLSLAERFSHRAVARAASVAGIFSPGCRAQTFRRLFSSHRHHAVAADAVEAAARSPAAAALRPQHVGFAACVEWSSFAASARAVAACWRVAASEFFFHA